MNNSTIPIQNNECLNDEIINLSYYTQNKVMYISRENKHINNTIKKKFMNDSQRDLNKFVNNSSSYFIKFTE
jgi:hypothetical protein